MLGFLEKPVHYPATRETLQEYVTDLTADVLPTLATRSKPGMELLQIFRTVFRVGLSPYPQLFSAT